MQGNGETKQRQWMQEIRERDHWKRETVSSLSHRSQLQPWTNANPKQKPNKFTDSSTIADDQIKQDGLKVRKASPFHRGSDSGSRNQSIQETSFPFFLELHP